jgi:hypothetical protein
MQAAIRPYGTAMRPYATVGIALVGAGIIAVSPIAPPVPKLHLPAISDGRVALSAFVNPIAQWVEVLTDSGNSLAGLGQIVAADPLPIITQLIQNQTANINAITGAIGQGVGQTVGTLAAIPQTLITAANQLAAGQPNAAVQTIWNGIALPGVFAIITPLLGTYPVFQQTVDNFAKVVDAVGTSLLGVGLSVLGPVQSVVNQFGSDTQAFADAIGTGDLGTAVSAIVNMPATLTNALLNGTAGTPGLLTPGTNPFDSGPIGALLRLRDTIAQALGAPSAIVATSATSNIAAVPSTTAKTVVLSGAATPKAIPGTATAAATPKSAQHTATDTVTDTVTKTTQDTPAPSDTGPAKSVSATDSTAPAASSSTPNGEADKGTDVGAASSKPSGEADPASTKSASGTKDRATSDSGSAGHDAAGATGRHHEKAAGAESAPKNGSESAKKHTSHEHESGRESAK